MKESNIIYIALLDDHKMFLDGMKSMLQAIENFKIVFVENTAKKALLQLKEFTPDIIITDISMPEMNGIEFIKEVKKDYPGIKILVLSMFHYLQSMEGIDGFFLKETDSKELIKAINGIVVGGKKYYLDTRKATDTLQFKKTILTTREKEIVILIAEEKTTDEIWFASVRFKWERKTIKQWQCHFNDAIIDQTAFEQHNFEDLLTEQEYKKLQQSCT
jgi:DNA-binding NarL/FixJ family response regulator